MYITVAVWDVNPNFSVELDLQLAKVQGFIALDIFWTIKSNSLMCEMLVTDLIYV